MSNRSKTHHYVPKSILKNFSIDSANKQLFAFDKHNKISFPVSVKNAGSEKYFHSIRIGDQEYNFEDYFSIPDGVLATLVTKIIKGESLSILTPKERSDLLHLTAFQMLRTREALNYREQYHNSINNIVSEALTTMMVDSETVKPVLGVYDKELQKKALLDLGETVEVLYESLVKKIAILHRTDDDHPYWISDNPVVQNNLHPLGNKGLSNLGTCVYFPISKNYLLEFRCRSLLYEGGNVSSLIEYAPFIEDDFVEKISFNTICPSIKNDVDYYNRIQVGESTRFVYSHQDHFPIAIDFLKENPKLAFSDTKDRFVLMNQDGVLDYPNRPKGMFLICQGARRHHELKITQANCQKLEFKADNQELMNNLLAEEKINMAIFICDGSIQFQVPQLKAIVMDYAQSLFRLDFFHLGMKEAFLKEA